MLKYLAIFLAAISLRVEADTIQNGDPLTIGLQNEFRSARPINSFDEIKSLRNVWLYCHAHNAANVKYGPTLQEESEGWVIWLPPKDGWIWQQDQEIQGRWSPLTPFRILAPWGLSASYRDLLGMSDFSSYRVGVNNTLVAEAITLTPASFPSDLHSPSVTTGYNDAFSYAKCSRPKP